MGGIMISKESLIMIAVLIMLVIGFMYWSEEQSLEIQNGVDEKIDEVLNF